MLDKEVPATIERKMVCMAAATLLAGALVLGFTSWTTLGWVVVAYGVMTLCFSYLFATAPYVEETERSWERRRR